MIVAPDEFYSVAEAGQILGRSERQVLRYLTDGRLRGSQASGRWRITALQIWMFQDISHEMLASWRDYCRSLHAEAMSAEENQSVTGTGE